MPHRDDPDEDETTSPETARPADTRVESRPGAGPGDDTDVRTDVADDDRYLPL
ncbi:hypothetical protein ACGFKZ_14885 [Micromonospora tulbaghiae]|uniref:hypothetical protein n=1 Tax=Micromonospora tulbaghiae TaxID=479978 RepID=UPI0033F556DF